jgi:hypothetical protein
MKQTLREIVDKLVNEECEGKGLPQQAEVAQGGSSTLRPPDFLDVRNFEGGRSSALRTGRLYLRRNHWSSFLEAESTPGRMVP